MKKLISIFFVALVLFNALGFYGLLVGIQYKSAKDLVARLDNEQYSEEETVTLRVPMALPYHIDKGSYERVDGEIEHNGEYYRLVKQKLEKDTLYIVCIKDHDSKRINRALSDYVKTFTDKPSNAKQSTKYLTSLIKDFLPSAIQVSKLSAGWNVSSSGSTQFTESFDSISQRVVSPPPRS